MLRTLLFTLATAVIAAGFSSAQTPQSRALNIYVIDAEGGNATFFVSPRGESLLMDTGNSGAAAPRDAGRIVDAMKDADVSQIDHLIITRWHGDHFGGLAELASRVPIREYIDHGPNTQPVAVFVLSHHTRMIANQDGSVYSTRCLVANAVYREDQWQRRSKHTELES